MNYGDTWYAQLLETAITPTEHGRDCIPADCRDVSLPVCDQGISLDSYSRISELLKAASLGQLKLDESFG